MSQLQAIFDLDIEAYLQGPTLVAALAAFGLAVGILTGLFGVGGAFLVTPLLKIGFGIPYELVIGSSLSFTIGSCSSGMRRHIRLGNLEPRSMLILAATSMAGAVLGAMLNKFLNVTLGEEGYTLTMHVLFVVILGLTAWLIARRSEAARVGKSVLQRLSLGPYIDLPAAGLARVSLPGIFAVGILIGVMKGMMGIGGGVLLMPLLIVVVGLTPHQAVGTSLGVVVFSSIAGAVKYGLDGNVNLWVVMSLLVGSVFGVQIGAWICHRLHAAKLRRYFAILVALVGLCVAGQLAYEILHRCAVLP